MNLQPFQDLRTFSALGSFVLPPAERQSRYQNADVSQLSGCGSGLQHLFLRIIWEGLYHLTLQRIATSRVLLALPLQCRSIEHWKCPVNACILPRSCHLQTTHTLAVQHIGNP